MTGQIVKTAAGKLRGSRGEGIAAFRSIPYAAAPTGSRRLAPPQAAATWDGIRSAEHQAQAPPQLPALAAEPSMGPMDVPGYDEDCLTLNVWTPSPGYGERLPVLVWFHGGGFLLGSGSASFYDGTVMARRGHMVVVSVSYRLGALGYLYLPPGARGPAPVANLGLQDQILALQWVQDNISAFGGDPDRVTVAGQSAGGLSIVGLSATPTARGLFRRAVLQSSGPSVPAKSVAEAERVTRAFFEAAGIAPDEPDSLTSLPVSRILEAQGQAIGQLVATDGYDPRLNPAKGPLPFQLVVDGDLLTDDPADAALERGSMDDADLMLMCTPDEMRFVMAFDVEYWQQNYDVLAGRLASAGGEDRVTRFRAYTELEHGVSAAEGLCNMLTDEFCVMPTIRLAERRARLGRPAYFAWFTWPSPAAGGRLGACHTIELPFVFNNLDNWAKAPMVAEADPAEVRDLADRVQDAWIAFAATGTPGPDFPPYTLSDRAAMQFANPVRIVHDPNGPRRRLWADRSAWS